MKHVLLCLPGCCVEHVLLCLPGCCVEHVLLCLPGCCVKHVLLCLPGCCVEHVLLCLPGCCVVSFCPPIKHWRHRERSGWPGSNQVVICGGKKMQNRRIAVCCWFLNVPVKTLVYLRDASAQTIFRDATLRLKLQIQLSTSPSHSILTPGRPVRALTLKRQAPGRVAT